MEFVIKSATVLLLLAATLLEPASPEQAAIISMVSNAEAKVQLMENVSSRATPPPSATMASSTMTTTTESAPPPPTTTTTASPQQPVARDLWSQSSAVAFVLSNCNFVLSGQ